MTQLAVVVKSKAPGTRAGIAGYFVKIRFTGRCSLAPRLVVAIDGHLPELQSGKESGYRAAFGFTIGQQVIRMKAILGVMESMP